jgi:hypothetical protein
LVLPPPPSRSAGWTKSSGSNPAPGAARGPPQRVAERYRPQRGSGPSHPGVCGGGGAAAALGSSLTAVLRAPGSGLGAGDPAAAGGVGERAPPKRGLGVLRPRGVECPRGPAAADPPSRGPPPTPPPAAARIPQSTGDSANSLHRRMRPVPAFSPWKPPKGVPLGWQPPRTGHWRRYGKTIPSAGPRTAGGVGGPPGRGRLRLVAPPRWAAVNAARYTSSSW